jgi:N6-L-threonylcarbamoyladenine synthase
LAEKYIAIDAELKNKKISLPRPMLNSGDYDFSFSGLKTAIRYELEKDKDWRNKISEYCHEFQQAIVDVLVKKTVKAAQVRKARTVMLCGGVSANKELRQQLEVAALKAGLRFAMPDLKYTTDNAVMIASAGFFKAGRGEFTEWREIGVDCNLGL